jgi:hypothetical protein
MQGGNADGDPVRHREAAAIDPCGWALVFVVAQAAIGADNGGSPNQRTDVLERASDLLAALAYS